MNDDNKPEQDSSRRGALKLLLGGSVVGGAAALPTRWTRPVVESVVLPAHALLSGPLYFLRTGGSAPLVGAVDPGQLLDLVVPSAVAGTLPSPTRTYNICITVNNGTATVRVNLPPDGEPACSLQGSGAVGGAVIELTDLCGEPGCMLDAGCTVNLNPDQTEASGTIFFVTPSEDEYSDDYTADLVEACALPPFPCPV